MPSVWKSENRVDSAALTVTFRSWLLERARPIAWSRLNETLPSLAAGSSRTGRWPGRAEITGRSCPEAAAESACRPIATAAARAVHRFGNLFIPLLLRQASYAIGGANVSLDSSSPEVLFRGKPARIINQPAARGRFQPPAVAESSPG